MNYVKEFKRLYKKALNVNKELFRINIIIASYESVDMNGEELDHYYKFKELKIILEDELKLRINELKQLNRSQHEKTKSI